MGVKKIRPIWVLAELSTLTLSDGENYRKRTDIAPEHCLACHGPYQYLSSHELTAYRRTRYPKQRLQRLRLDILSLAIRFVAFKLDESKHRFFL